MDKRIVYTIPSGQVWIEVPNESAMLAGETEAEFLARLQAILVPVVLPDGSVVRPRHVPEGVAGTQLSSKIVGASLIPDDRTFRDAFTDEMPGPQIDIDMPKARAIHMDRIRLERDRELAKLDVEFTKAQGRKDQAQADRVEAKRQALRDVPTTFDLSGATTPAELGTLWPAEIIHRWSSARGTNPTSH